MKFFDDLVVGERYELGSHTFTADAIKIFARRFDPQPFHLDEAAAARSHFGALCASGWHTASVWMRLMVQYQVREDAARRARGDRAVDGVEVEREGQRRAEQLGPSLGAGHPLDAGAGRVGAHGSSGMGGSPCGESQDPTAR